MLDRNTLQHFAVGVGIDLTGTDDDPLADWGVAAVGWSAPAFDQSGWFAGDDVGPEYNRSETREERLRRKLEDALKDWQRAVAEGSGSAGEYTEEEARAERKAAAKANRLLKKLAKAASRYPGVSMFEHSMGLRHVVRLLLVILAVAPAQSVAREREACDESLASLETIGRRAHGAVLQEYFDRINAAERTAGTQSQQWWDAVQQLSDFSEAHPYRAATKAHRLFGRRQMRHRNADKWALRAGASWHSFIASKDEATRQDLAETWREAAVLCGASAAAADSAARTLPPSGGHP